MTVRFKEGDIVRFNPERPDEFGADKGALAKVKGYYHSIGKEWLDVVWLDKSTSHNQCDGGYRPKNFTLAAPQAEDQPALTDLAIDLDALALSIAYGDKRKELLRSVRGISQKVLAMRKEAA